MDIVNWLYLKKAELIRDAIDSPEDLVLLGADVSFEKRGDKYLTYAVPVSLLMGGSSSITLKTNGTNNTVQTTLDLVEGNNITITDNGDGSVTIDSTGGPGNVYTVNNGLSESPANNFQLGGSLIDDTPIDGSFFNYELTIEELAKFEVTTAGRSRIHNEGPGVTEYTEVQFTDALAGIEYSSLTTSYSSSVSVEGTTGLYTAALMRSASPYGIVSIGMGTNSTGNANAIYIKTPNVSNGTATIGQVLTLKEITGPDTARVEFEDGSGTPVTITADEGVTASTSTNVQLGASSYAGSTFSTDRFIDTTTKALFIKGQVASSFTTGGIKTGVLNITNDLNTGTPVGLIVNVTDTNITSGRGILVNTSKATGIEVLSDTGRGIDIATTSTIEKCAYIASASTSALEISTQGNGTNRLAIEALKYGSTNNVVEPVISVTKSSNAGNGAIGIGSSIRFSAATSTVGTVNELGNLAYVATNVTSGAMSSYFRVAARDLGTEKYVLTVDAKGIFTLVQGLGNYPNDAAAAVGGVPLNGLYRNGSAVQIRSI